MNLLEKTLYHQIHPAKLATDVSTSVVSTLLFWDHEILLGLSIGIIPSIIVSALIIRHVNLEHYRNSRLGQYVGRYMTSSMQGLRLVGQIVAWFGAWYQSLLTVAAGFLIILLAWGRGKIFPGGKAPIAVDCVPRASEAFTNR